MVKQSEVLFGKKTSNVSAAPIHFFLCAATLHRLAYQRINIFLFCGLFGSDMSKHSWAPLDWSEFRLSIMYFQTGNHKLNSAFGTPEKLCVCSGFTMEFLKIYMDVTQIRICVELLLVFWSKLMCYSIRNLLQKHYVDLVHCGIIYWYRTSRSKTIAALEYKARSRRSKSLRQIQTNWCGFL